MTLVNEATGYRSRRCDGALDGGETRRVVLKEGVGGGGVDNLLGDRKLFVFCANLACDAPRIFSLLWHESVIARHGAKNFVPCIKIVPIIHAIHLTLSAQF